MDEVSILEYIPYARRSVSAVLPPLAPSPGQPKYASRLHRVVTVPAPWSVEEKWRAPRPRLNDEGSSDESVDHDEEYGEDVGLLEKEDATLEEPNELVIWVEGDEFCEGADLDKVIGMGLRGRWALMGKSERAKDHEAWWTFKAKDCSFLLFCLAARA